MATAEELRQMREQQSIFAALYDLVNQQNAQLASEGRRPVLGGLLSKEPVEGVDTIRYEGIGNMLAGLLAPAAKAFDAPMAAAQGNIPREDMLSEALGTAGMAMLGGGAVPLPKGAIGANMLRSGKMTDPTETGWTFRDVKVPNLTKEENRKVYEALSVPRGYEVELPIRRLFATQDSVNPDFATTTSSQGRIPTVIRKGGEFFIRDGHHRLTKQAEAGNQNAKVWLYDLDNQNRDTPLLDYEAPKELKGERLAEVNRFLDELGLLDDTLAANASKSAGAVALPAAKNEAEAMARQILEMRAAGRAGDVTDEMMAQADPQYMFANTPLPMDEASRMARAAEMGFEGDWLHGTGSDIVQVNPEKLGQKQNVLGQGFYQTENPKRSDRYVPKEVNDQGELVFSEGGNVLPIMSKSANEFDLTAQTGKENINRIARAFEGSDFEVRLRDDGGDVFIQSKADPRMSVFLDSYAEGQNTLMRLKDAFGNNNVTKILEEAGFTGLKGLEGAGSKVRVNYNPQDVRSRFARFDPEFSHLANLTAANASPIGGLLAQSGVSSEQAQRIEDYLQRTGLLQ